MDAFKDDDLIVAQLGVTPCLALAFKEVEAGHLHLFASQQPGQGVVKKRQVDGVQVLKIVIALCIARRQLTVNKVIVQLHRKGVQPLRQQLYGQPLGKSCLAG